MSVGDFMAEEQKARMQAIKDSQFRAANDEGGPATDLAGVGPSSFSPPEYNQDLQTLILSAADDLDRLEELEPEPGRVGRANHLRRFAKSWRLRTDFAVEVGDTQKEDG